MLQRTKRASTGDYSSQSWIELQSTRSTGLKSSRGNDIGLQKRWSACGSNLKSPIKNGFGKMTEIRKLASKQHVLHVRGSPVAVTMQLSPSRKPLGGTHAKFLESSRKATGDPHRIRIA